MYEEKAKRLPIKRCEGPGRYLGRRDLRLEYLQVILIDRMGIKDFSPGFLLVKNWGACNCE